VDLDDAVAARHLAAELALERGLIDAGRAGPWLVGPRAEPTPLAVRAYLGLLHGLHHAGAVPRLDFYIAAAMTDNERERADSMIGAGLIDAYRFGLAAVDRFTGIDCREVAYLRNLAGAWRYERDPDLVDVGRMCDVLSLFSWFLHLYRDLEPDHLATWPHAHATCLARNRYLTSLDHGRATAAALDVIGAEEKDPERFR
jgi:hypothetical protein